MRARTIRTDEQREHHVCLIKSALSVRTSTSRQVRGFICCNHTARPPSIYYVCIYVYIYICFIFFPPSFRYWPSSRPPSVRPLSTSSVCRFFFFIPFRTGNRARQLTGGGRKKTHRKLRGSLHECIYIATARVSRCVNAIYYIHCLFYRDFGERSNYTGKRPAGRRARSGPGVTLNLERLGGRVVRRPFFAARTCLATRALR